MPHSEKINNTGEMYATTSGGVTCYDIFTFAGKYRGGKIYKNDKRYIILSGKCELTQEFNKKDSKKYISPKDGILEIPAGIPHIFYFPEDTRMLEWFPERTQSENFERYRKMK